MKKFVLVILLLIANRTFAAAISEETLVYVSSVDKTPELKAALAYVPDGKPKPLVVVMHGLCCSHLDVVEDIRIMAPQGLFGVAPSMRGESGAGGKHDCGGLEIHDILDAILEAIRKHPAEIDARNINLIGFSGGGGNAFSAVTRFPDLFHLVCPFFGISDYGLWYQLHGNNENDVFNKIMIRSIGGTPQQLPHHYAARNSCLAAGNSPGTQIHIFWDELEAVCFPVMNQKFLEAYQAAGLKNATAHISKPGDALRFPHGYRTAQPDIAKAEDALVPEMLKPVPDLSLPPKGTLTVCGYLVCRHFQVFVEDGQQGVVKINYDLTGKVPQVVVSENPDQLKVKISLDSPLSELPR